jgi:hypothetical protein
MKNSKKKVDAQNIFGATQKAQGLGLDVYGIPVPIVERAVVLAEKLLAGSSIRSVGGKTLVRDRKVVSVPIGMNWRLLCAVVESNSGEEENIQPIRVVSHSEYNRVITAKKINKNTRIRECYQV